MLHFRFSIVLKDLLKASLKRPSPGSTEKIWLPPARRCSTVSAESRAVSSQLRVLHAATHRPALRTAPGSAPFRSYCVKTEGSVDVDEQLKKDRVSCSEEAGDK